MTKILSGSIIAHVIHFHPCLFFFFSPRPNGLPMMSWQVSQPSSPYSATPLMKYSWRGWTQEFKLGWSGFPTWMYVFLCTWWDGHIQAFVSSVHSNHQRRQKKKKKINWLLNKHVCWIIEALRPEQALISIEAFWTQSAEWQEDQWTASHVHHCKICFAIQPGWTKQSEACNSIAMFIFKQRFRSTEQKKIKIIKSFSKWMFTSNWFTHMTSHLTEKAS